VQEDAVDHADAVLLEGLWVGQRPDHLVVERLQQVAHPADVGKAPVGVRLDDAPGLHLDAVGLDHATVARAFAVDGRRAVGGCGFRLAPVVAVPVVASVAAAAAACIDSLANRLFDAVGVGLVGVYRQPPRLLADERGQPAVVPEGVGRGLRVPERHQRHAVGVGRVELRQPEREVTPLDLGDRVEAVGVEVPRQPVGVPKLPKEDVRGAVVLVPVLLDAPRQQRLGLAGRDLELHQYRTTQHRRVDPEVVVACRPPDQVAGPVGVLGQVAVVVGPETIQQRRRGLLVGPDELPLARLVAVRDPEDRVEHPVEPFQLFVVAELRQRALGEYVPDRLLVWEPPVGVDIRRQPHLRHPRGWPPRPQPAPRRHRRFRWPPPVRPAAPRGHGRGR